MVEPTTSQEFQRFLETKIELLLERIVGLEDEKTKLVVQVDNAQKQLNSIYHTEGE